MRSWNRLRRKLVRKPKSPVRRARALLVLASLLSGAHRLEAQRRLALADAKQAKAQNDVVLGDLKIEREKLEIRSLEQKLGISHEPFAPESDTPR